MGQMSFVDPFDQQALNLLEDKLGARCSCAQGRNPEYCDIHNGSRLVELLDRAELLSPAEAEQQVEAEKEKWEAEQTRKNERLVTVLKEVVNAIEEGVGDSCEPPDEAWWREWKTKAEAILEEVQS